MKNLFSNDSSKNIAVTDEAMFEEVKENRDIAIVGMALKLPEANTAQEFWDILVNERDCIREVSGQRKADILEYLDVLGHEDKELIQYGYIDDVDKFDYKFFGYTPLEADYMDPAQRLFLQTAYHALEDAGYSEEKIKGSNTGVFVGFSGDSFYKGLTDIVVPKSPMAVTGNMPSLIGGRISHVFDLKGPNIVVNTTCSSALVSLHYACQSLRNKECSMALVGSSNLLNLPKEGLKGLGIESPTYRTRAFDDKANGTGAGEGVAAIVVKRYSDAKKDGDHIYAVIKGSAINHDGNSIGITAPNSKSQQEVIEKALKDAGVHPNTISYIEAHGTGTKLGDPIEIEGISNAFAKYTDRKQFCAIGSVKTNVGHTFISSGMVSLIKAILSINRKIIPASLNFDTPNRQINFENSPVYVNEATVDWEAKDFPRRCGVSSFGLSGTNAHIILEEVFDQEEPSEESSLEMLAVSAKSKNSLSNNIKQYIQYIETHKELSLHDFCITLNQGRSHYNYRAAFVCSSVDELQEKLQLLLKEVQGEVVSEDIYFQILENNQLKEEADSGELVNKLIGQHLSNAQNTEVLIQLCSRYVQGDYIEWPKLYSNTKYKKLALPTYQFEEKRCWLDFEKVRAQRKKEQELKANLLQTVESKKSVKTVSAKDAERKVFEPAGQKPEAVRVIDKQLELMKQQLVLYGKRN